MLTEYKQTSQNEIDKGISRRWFSDDYFDLIIWYDSKSEIEGFQLCYNKYGKPHALTWKKEFGFSHDAVDEGGIGHNLITPILVADGYFPYRDIYKKLSKAIKGVDRSISGFVLIKVREFSKEQSM